MRIFGINISREKPQVQPKKRRSSVIASGLGVEANNISRSWTVTFDGEKNHGEIGPIIDYSINYLALSNRSWQSYLESDISKTVIDRYAIWVIDKGLKLQSTPVKMILESEGVSIDTERFNNIVEARFEIWAKSKRSSYNGMISFNDVAKKAFKNSKIGGDVLVILRYIKNNLTVQLIDGRHLRYNSFENTESKNRVKNGIEIDENGRHIRYWIKNKNNEYQPIPAWEKSTGLRTAFLVYGSEYRLDDYRGLPKIAVSLETIAKTDRYKEATTAAAEERAKVPYFFENSAISDESNPLSDMASMYADVNDGTVPIDDQGNALAKTVAASLNKQVFNLTRGQTVKAMDAKAETAFKEFYGTNADIVCAAVGIPPNVAFSIYNDSFSASRAATKDWDHTLQVDRDDFYNQFYSNVYAMWFHYEVLTSKIQAPGYLKAFYEDKNYSIVEAYLHCEFVGPYFPHIDPLKEVKAERAKLGPKGDSIPLTTVEQATLSVGTGEANSNIEQFANEYKLAEDNGLIDDVVVPVIPSGG